MEAVETGVPSGPEELWRDYYGLAMSIVRKMGVPAQEAEDVTSTVMTRLLESDVIAMYRPDHVSGRTGSAVSFRSFFAANVSIRGRGQRDKLSRTTAREALVDSTAGEGTAMDLFGGSWWDDLSHLDVAEFVTRMRTWLALQPPRSDLDNCDLVSLFDEIVRELFSPEGDGKVSYPAIMEKFGVGYTTARSYVARFREAAAAGRDQRFSGAWEIGGVSLGITGVREAVTILRSKKSTNVLLPLRHHGHPLAGAGDWYHQFAAEEIELFPELAKPAGTRQKHYGKVKGAVIHRLERMLAEVVSPPAELSASSELKVVEVPEEGDPAELLESILWKLGADAGTVSRGMALAAQVPAS